MLRFLQDHVAILGWISAALFLGGLLLVPFLILRIPHDYFLASKKVAVVRFGQHPLLRAVWLIAKNLLGSVMLIVGIIMLVAPGPGILFVLLGMALVDFVPGKRRLQLWLITRPRVLESVNALRAKNGRRPVLLPDKSSQGLSG